nr:glutathione S-transferase family protein [uncultured Moellerella sp.]
MSQLVLYTNAMSRGNSVELLLKILDVPYQRIELAYGAEMRTPEYLAINPMAKVPALVDGELIVTETAAICAYLADKFIDKGLAPALDAPERAAYYRWLFFVAGPIEGAFTIRDLGLTLDEEQQKASGFGSFDRALNGLMQGILAASPYLCGSKMTAADIYVGYFVLFLLKFKIIEPTEPVEKYIQHLALNSEFNKVINDLV